MAFGGKAGFGSAVFCFFKRAGAEHLEQISASQSWFLLPEQTALFIAIAEDGGFQRNRRMRIAVFTLIGKKQCQFLGEQFPRQCFSVFALLVALGIRKLSQNHFGRAAITLFVHQLGRSGQTLLYLAAFALAVAFSLLGFGTADPVKTTMLAQVINDPCPLFMV